VIGWKGTVSLDWSFRLAKPVAYLKIEYVALIE
jgi:hypothetical protein